MKRRFRMSVAILSVILVAIGIRHILRTHLHKRREIGYQATLSAYERSLKPGMTRKDVESYLNANGRRFSQSCCIDVREFRKRSWDDLVKIGSEDAPWFCSENAVYVGFQFADGPSHHDEMWRADELDRLKSITIYHRLENCL